VAKVTLKISAVDFSYGRRQVLSDISWELGTGVTGLLGPNGAGKTTLINLLVGITKPSSGNITISGIDGVTRSVRDANIGFVPQRFSVAGELRVLDTIAYAAWINGVAPKLCAASALAALDTVHLGDQASQRVRQLSGGQRQRLGIAAALSHAPDVLVLDEPTVGLDPGQRVRARGIIQEIGKRVPVLLSTHLIEDVSHLCTRVGVIVDGRLVFDGPQEQLETKLDEQPDTDQGLGSRFERSYQSLITEMATHCD
jgi:ABC-2 type transport system ATP-binding protein